LTATPADAASHIEPVIHGWAVRDVDGFAERYRAARLLLMEYWSDQIVDIADDPELDPRDRQIRTAVRQWIMARITPRRWGDKVQLGSDPDSPLRRRRSKV
jgi:Bacteriophage Sf6, terminase small subunit-like